jgi:ceramide glucosyltransferase
VPELPQTYDTAMKASVMRPSTGRYTAHDMDMLAYACLTFSAIALACQTGTCAAAILRCRDHKTRVEPRRRPGITVVRLLCGLEQYSRETLHSTFQIDYPAYEILLCVADERDPIVPLAQAVVAEYPKRSARVLIGNDVLGENPKLNNMAKGFRAAQFDHVVFVDSNVYTPPDYLDQLAGAMERGTGMVSAPPIGIEPQGFWAKVECAFLNSYQARVQYAADRLGFGFAQGKTLFFRRKDLELGGLERLASEPAEDAAATKLMRSTGRRIRLAGPFPQLIGYRSFTQIWKRQVRWARLRRASFPALFAPEVFAGLFPPLLALLYGMHAVDIEPALPALFFVLVWYASETSLARVAGWPFSLCTAVTRDLLLPFVFLSGCLGRQIEWHGHRLTTSSSGSSTRHSSSSRSGKVRWLKLTKRV